jgi:hypothetical protein
VERLRHGRSVGAACRPHHPRIGGLAGGRAHRDRGARIRRPIR